MALKAMELDGKGGSTNVSRAIYYAVDHGARVINLSVGGKSISKGEQQALDYAAAKGVVVVAASGNEGIDTAGFSPAGLRHVLTVAAIDPDLKRPPFSNWGANVALAAPGVDVLSLRARQTDLLMFARKDYKPGTAVVKGSYYRVTGSSFSAPMVSGAASLLLSVRPELTAEQVTRMLEQSARDVSGIGRDQFTGYGLIDIDAALKADPNAYVEAAIAGVGVAQANGRTVVRVSGTAASDQLKEAYIEIGAGDTPTSWKRVSRTISTPVTGGVLDDLDPSAFAGGKEWTLRVIAVSRSGKQREARYKLSLG
jgi:subtilisin family serine protease